MFCPARSGGSMKHRALQVSGGYFGMFRPRHGARPGFVREAHHRQETGQRLTVIICERPEAPVFSFYTHVDAGSVQDPMGKTGLAHMFEHMAFKGTDTIGTTDYAAEKIALAKVENAYAAYIAGARQTSGTR